jgi:hypothetical protein
LDFYSKSKRSIDAGGTLITEEHRQVARSSGNNILMVAVNGWRRKVAGTPYQDQLEEHFSHLHACGRLKETLCRRRLSREVIMVNCSRNAVP